MEQVRIIKKARIYKITSPNTEKVYIGSTTTGLNRRLTMHHMCYRSWIKGKQNRTTSFDILACGEPEIELIEELQNVTKDDVKKREANAQKNTLHCVNKKIEGRTKKEYYKENKEKFLLRAKVRYWKNKSKKHA